jgi:RecA-family ATPase
MAACDVEDTNSNSDAVKMMKMLRGLAAEHGVAILLLHHERKRPREGTQNSSQATLASIRR